MKIWIVTTDNRRSGTETSVHLTEAAAEAVAVQWCKDSWCKFFGPMPEDWREARETISASMDGDYLWFEEHDLTPPPLTAPERPLSFSDVGSHISTVWAALADLEDLRGTDEGMDDVKTAMAWIAEGLGVEDDDAEAGQNDDAYRAAARAEWYDEGSCEIDDLAQVNVSEDGGAYVQAWVWVSNEDAGIKELGDCADCGKPAEDEWDEDTPVCRDCHMQRQDEEHLQ